MYPNKEEFACSFSIKSEFTLDLFPAEIFLVSLPRSRMFFFPSPEALGIFYNTLGRLEKNRLQDRTKEAHRNLTLKKKRKMVFLTKSTYAVFDD